MTAPQRMVDSATALTKFFMYNLSIQNIKYLEWITCIRACQFIYQNYLCQEEF